MGPPRKIATCCYCRTRAALVLAGFDRHELACANCGAPLRDLKMLPLASLREPTRPAPSPRPARKPRPAKRRRRAWLNARAAEVWDEIEDWVD